MNKKTILKLSVIALLGTSLYAKCNEDRGFNIQHQHDMISHNMMKHKKGGIFFRALRDINLTKEQKEQLTSIMQKSRKNTIISDAFTSSSFNKEKFIQLSKEKRDNRFNKKAMMIEKVYDILTIEQKKDLKILLDAQNIRQKNIMKNRRNCKG